MVQSIGFNQLSPDERLDVLWSYVEERIPLYLVGPAGSGKSFIGLELMRRFSEKYLRGERIVWLREIDEASVQGGYTTRALYVSGSANITKLDLLGGRILLGGQYIRKPGLLNEMVKHGGIVFLDEITSLPPQFTVLLNEIIDMMYRGESHENFYIFFAGNPYYYLGTNELPDSLLERVVSIWFDYYNFKDELKIAMEIVKKKLGDNLLFKERGFQLLAEYIVSVLRMIRKSLNEAGENCPISVRSMATAIIGTIILSRTMGYKESSGYSRASIYRSLRGNLPDNLAEVWSDDAIAELFDFMEKYGLSWRHVNEAVRNLGIFQKVTDKRVLENALAQIPL